MGDVLLLRSGNSRTVNWTLAGLLGLLLITTISIVPLTLTILQLRQSDALVIDMAGRQRMLLERHMKELLLSSQGLQAQPAKSRALLRERLDALINGGSIVSHLDRDETVVLPAAPTDEIREKLLEQRRLLDAFMSKADRLLHMSQQTAEYGAVLRAILKDNAVLLDVSNDAVLLLTRHSEDRVRTLIRWELAAVLLVVAIASLRTWRFLRAENEVKSSQTMTMEALRQRDAVKSSFLASVSHQLRTPLTSIKTMLFSLRDDPSLQPAHVRAEFLKSIDQELDGLDRLVGNLLDMSRIEAGMFTPKREWHVVEELLEGAIRQVGRPLERRPLHVSLAPDLPPIYVDGVEIQQVLVNLLDNAVKFSSTESPIQISASIMAERIELSVSNVGKGIPSEDLHRVFDRFYRVPAGRTPGTPGVGLGLAICKGIVEAHGGQITAHSIPDGETTISFWLPLTAAVPVPEPMTAQG